MDSWVMACGMQADTMHAMYEVAVGRLNGRRGCGMWRWMASMANNVGGVRVTWHWGLEEEI